MKTNHKLGIIIVLGFLIVVTLVTIQTYQRIDQFMEENKTKEKPVVSGNITVENGIVTFEDGTKVNTNLIRQACAFFKEDPKDCIPSIDNPKFISAAEADWLPEEELGLGIVYKGESRFYPYRILVSHEIVNDIIQGDPILITFCPLCFTGIGFIREIDGEAVKFGTSGKLYNSELVMYDRKTNSYWPQSLGRAVTGPSLGKKIQKIPTDTIEWGNWKKVHPDTKVLSRDTGFSISYTGRNPYGLDGDFSSIQVGTNFDDTLENLDTRLPRNEIVYGIEVNGKFKAYKKTDLENKLKIEDVVGGQKLTIEFDQDLGSARATLETGDDILVETLFWFAWAAFHPETELFA